MDILFCLLIADFITGIAHWVEDTYFVPGKIEWFNRQVVEPNIYHHQVPYPIIYDNYIKINAVSIVLALISTGVLMLLGVTSWQPFLVLALASQGNQTHQWAHNPKSPKFILWLQSFGLLLSVKQHSKHHIRPYEINYCTITSWLNPVLDYFKVWRGFEWAVNKLGIRVKRGSSERQGY